MKEKLDCILKGIENLTTRIDKLDSKFVLFETRLSNLEKTFDDYIYQLDKKLETKVNCTVLENFASDYKILSSNRLPNERKT